MGSSLVFRGARFFETEAPQELEEKKAIVDENAIKVREFVPSLQRPKRTAARRSES